LIKLTILTKGHVLKKIDQNMLLFNVTD